MNLPRLSHQSHAFPPLPSHSWRPCISLHHSLKARYRQSLPCQAVFSAETGGTWSLSHIWDKAHRTAPGNEHRINDNRVAVFNFLFQPVIFHKFTREKWWKVEERKKSSGWQKLNGSSVHLMFFWGGGGGEQCIFGYLESYI